MFFLIWLDGKNRIKIKIPVVFYYSKQKKASRIEVCVSMQQYVLHIKTDIGSKGEVV